MKALVFGSRGQLGVALHESLPAEMSATFLDAKECDITDPAAVLRAVEDCRPDVLINAAAYTAVDLAESEPGKARAVNVDGARNLATAACENDARLVHVSTDFVFDGSATSPIMPDAPTRPISVYGQTKRDGELAALKANPERTAIVRTAWVYSKTGKNFVKTILKLMAERDELGVVGDQVGSPTWANSLAEVCWVCAADDGIAGIFHWTDAGVTSWHGFAEAIQQTGMELGLLDKQIPVRSISTDQYPTPAARPRYSVLDCSTTTAATGLEQADWHDNLKLMMQEL